MKSLMNMKTPLGAWLGEELAGVSLVMSDHLTNKHKEVSVVCEKLEAYKGKMLRPSMVLLSWKATNQDGGTANTPESVRIASGVAELIHLATLVHDDVLDDADLRRGVKTINCLLGNEAAVMLGDYLLSSAFLLCSTIQNPKLNLLLGGVTNTLCAGELVQLSNRNNVDLSIESYYQIIHDKTASLIAASCEMGAIIGGGKPEQIQAMKDFGSAIGVAFQIKDDLLDVLGERSMIGKPAGRDLEKGKLTLPVITMLAENPTLKPRVLAIMREKDREGLRALLESTGAIEHAYQKVRRLVDSATNGIRGCVKNDASEQLCLLAEQINTVI
ncbi:MAG: polyprenyl synthetase family protein [Phycisphaerales bacterium]